MPKLLLDPDQNGTRLIKHDYGTGYTKFMLSRSEQMSRIRGKDTGPEIRLRRALWHRGLRYRLYERTCAGRPDLVFKGPRVAIFIDGCFWHGCPSHYVFPRSRRDFWRNKLKDNVERDRRQTAQLEESGWLVLRFWEHEIYEDLDDVVDRVILAVQRERHDPPHGWRVENVEIIDPESDLERRHLVTLREPTRRKTVERLRTTEKWDLHS